MQINKKTIVCLVVVVLLIVGFGIFMFNRSGEVVPKETSSTSTSRIETIRKRLSEEEKKIVKDSEILQEAKVNIIDQELLEKEISDCLNKRKMAFKNGAEWLKNHSEEDTYYSSYGEALSYDQVLDEAEGLMEDIKIYRKQLLPVTKKIQGAKIKIAKLSDSICKRSGVLDRFLLMLESETTQSDAFELLNDKSLAFEEMFDNTKVNSSLSKKDRLEAISKFSEALDLE